MAHLPISAESPGFTPPSEINNFGKLPAAGKAGRPKGSANKFTTDLKMMILGALHDAGGRDYLHKQAIANPTAFMGLVGKVLPTTLVGDPKRPIHISVTEEERHRAVDAALDAVFGVSNNVSNNVSNMIDVSNAVSNTIEHEAETASANSEPQDSGNAGPDDKIVQLSHVKSHTAD